MLNEITLRSPFSYFNNLENELNRSAFGKETINLPLNYKRDQEKLLMSLDIPGVDKSDLEIEILENKLTISGERKDNFEQSDFSDKAFGKFKKVFTLPKDLDFETLKANYENGVLNIEIQNSKKESSKKILIN